MLPSEFEQALDYSMRTQRETRTYMHVQSSLSVRTHTQRSPIYFAFFPQPNLKLHDQRVSEIDI